MATNWPARNPSQARLARRPRVTLSGVWRVTDVTSARQSRTAQVGRTCSRYPSTPGGPARRSRNPEPSSFLPRRRTRGGGVADGGVAVGLIDLLVGLLGINYPCRQ